VPEMLVEPLKELEKQFLKYYKDEEFQKVTEYINGAKIYLKREDLNFTGAHKINNTIGQVLLAKRMGKKKIIAETGAGQHGVATATVCALFNMGCKIFMGEKDIKRQELNVFKMRLLGAEVIPATGGEKTLKDAVDEALMEYAKTYEDTFYLLGSVVGPHPYPLMVREFQSIIGKEAKEQILEKESKLPDYLIACVGGGSNAMGLFSEFIENKSVKMIGVEPAGLGLETSNRKFTCNRIHYEIR